MLYDVRYFFFFFTIFSRTRYNDQLNKNIYTYINTLNIFFCLYSDRIKFYQSSILYSLFFVVQGGPLKSLSSKSESVLRDWRTVKCKASFQPVRLFTFGNIRSSIIRGTVGRIRRYRNPIYTRPLPIYTGHDNGAI